MVSFAKCFLLLFVAVVIHQNVQACDIDAIYDQLCKPGNAFEIPFCKHSKGFAKMLGAGICGFPGFNILCEACKSAAKAAGSNATATGSSNSTVPAANATVPIANATAAT